MLTFAAFIFFLTFFILIIKIRVIFYKIMAKKEGRGYRGLFNEYWGAKSETFTISINDFHYYPLSYFLYHIDPRDYDVESDEVKALYHQKFKYEKILWGLFLLGLLSILLMEYVISPMLLK